MKQNQRLLGVIVAGVLAALAIAGFAAVRYSNDWRREYPAEGDPPPFSRWDASLPRLMLVSESATFEDRTKTFFWLTQQGAIRHASLEEQQALQAVDREELVKARELGERCLEANPDSAPAAFVMATVELRGDANLPRALFLVRKLRHTLEEAGRRDRHDIEACEWYIRGLDLEYEILSEMDRREEQLRVVDLLEDVFEPRMPWMRLWPLMKLRRWEEANRQIEATLADGRNPSKALNAKCALEDKMHHRQGSYDAGKQMVEAHPDSSVLRHNWGLAAFNLFRYDEAERYMTEATTHSLDFHGTPYLPLALLELQRGEFAQAFEKLRLGLDQRFQRDRHTLQQDEALMDDMKALLLLALGRGADALRFAREAHESPDRAGATSNDDADLRFSSTLVLWTVLRTRAEQIRELRAAQAGVRGWLPDPELEAITAECWALERTLRTDLAEDMLDRMIRPNMPGSPGIETAIGTWLRPDAARVLPTGVALEAIRLARDEADLPETVPYLDAVEAETRLRHGDAAEALRLAQQSLLGLPAKNERLLRARVAAVAAEAAHRTGDEALAREYCDEVLAVFPQAFRLLELSIPVHVVHDDSPAARRMAEWLLASPRFRDDPQGFAVSLTVEGDRLHFVMQGAAGKQHCAESVPAEGDTDEVAGAGLQLFYRKLMAASFDLSDAQLGLLDDSADAQRSREQDTQLLDGVRPDK